MKKCDTCIYRNQDEYHKPCIVYRDDCEYYEKERGDMKQYCRYCVNLCVNNVPYCDAHKQCLSRSYCTHTNNCKDFVFADVEPEYQDAFGETNGYKPRQPRQKQIDGQMSLF